MTTADAEPPTRPAGTRPHPVHRFLGRLHQVLDEVGDSTSTLWALSPAELGQCLEEAYAAQARLSALTLAVLAQADRTDLATHDAAPTLTAWLREHTRLAPVEGKRQIRLAHGLEQHPLTHEALATGAIPAASAAVIIEAVQALPDEIDPALTKRAETHLAGEAHTHDTATLRRLATHLEEVIDPDGADARLADQLARAEAHAARHSFFTLHHDHHTATTDGTFRIPLTHGIKLQRMLESLTNPARPTTGPATRPATGPATGPTTGPATGDSTGPVTGDSTGDSTDPLGTDPLGTDPRGTDPVTGVRLSAEERRGHALAELIDRIPTHALPTLAGSNATVVVTMSIETLTGGPTAAHLDTGHPISPGAARRLAAQAGVIPAVLGTSSEIVDLGRKARLFTTRQRLAMTIQQGGTCAVDTCQSPAAWGEAHHLTPWHHNGPTDLTNGVLICPRHHTLADHPDYHVTHPRPGRIQIHRRC